MKKTISLILTLVLCLSLCACGGNDANNIVEEASTQPTETTALEESIPTPAWQAQQAVDEFGDPVPNGDPVVSSVFTGNFSNTATTESDLIVGVYINKNADTQHYYVGFRLWEYGDNPITYLSSDEESITLKIKVGDLIEEFELIGSAPSGDLILAQGDAPGVNFAGDYLFDLLHHGIDVRCIINIGSSKYNFTIPSENFVHACIDAGFTPEEWLEGRTVTAGTPLLISEFRTAFSNTDEKNTSRFWDYFYNEDGLLMKAISTHYLDGTITYSYDDSGKLISSETQTGWMGVESDGNTCIIFTEYNEYGNPTKETTTYRCPENWPRKDGEVEVTTYEYEYNEDGTVKSQKPYVDGELSWRWYSYTYEYDAAGQLVSAETQYHEDDYVGTIKTLYTYDEQGNLIFEKTIDPDDNTLRETIVYGYIY